MEAKKLALLRILEILQERTDGGHPLTYDEIVEILGRDYGIEVERKLVGRNVSLLKEAGYEIETTRRGAYLAVRQFEDAELRVLIDGVLSSKHITPKHSAELIERLCALSNRYFRKRVKNIYSVRDWAKTDNVAVFYGVETVDEAIERGRQVRFDYNKYGADKKLHRSATHTVSPYQMILHNQRYYLMGYNEKWGHIQYFRMDRITNIVMTEAAQTPLRSVKGFESGIDYKRFSSAMPYMFADEPQSVEFIADGWAIDQIVDWFGGEIRVEERDDGRFLVRARASVNAMEFWAMQYLNVVEIVAPKELRERIKRNVQAACEKYDK